MLTKQCNKQKRFVGECIFLISVGPLLNKIMNFVHTALFYIYFLVSLNLVSHHNSPFQETRRNPLNWAKCFWCFLVFDLLKFGNTTPLHEDFKVCLYKLNRPSLRANEFTFLKSAKKLILTNLDQKLEIYCVNKIW